MTVVSLNMNKGRPDFDRLLEFLVGQDADLIFLNEVLHRHVLVLSVVLGMHSYWSAMSQSYFTLNEIKGNLILSKEPLTNVFVHDLGSFDQERKGPRYEDLNIKLVGGFCQELGCVVACTHLPWSHTWEVDDVQCKALGQLNIKIVDERLALLGLDVNSARVLPNGEEGAIWRDLSSVLSDGVPQEITTTLDPSHRFGDQPTVVDGLFFNPRLVRVTSLTTNTGLSDHRALVAFVEAVNDK